MGVPHKPDHSSQFVTPQKVASHCLWKSSAVYIGHLTAMHLLHPTETPHPFGQIHGGRWRPLRGCNTCHLGGHVGLQGGPQDQPQNCVLWSSPETSLRPNYVSQCVDEYRSWLGESVRERNGDWRRWWWIFEEQIWDASSGVRSAWEKGPGLTISGQRGRCYKSLYIR